MSVLTALPETYWAGLQNGYQRLSIMPPEYPQGSALCILLWDLASGRGWAEEFERVLSQCKALNAILYKPQTDSTFERSAESLRRIDLQVVLISPANLELGISTVGTLRK